MATERPPDSLDPAYAFSPRSWQILANTGAGLMAFRRVPGPDGAAVVPDLAAAAPLIGDGGRTLVFQLRQGARFGPPARRPVRASDVRATLERLFRAGSPGRVLYRGIVGARRFERGHAAGIAGIVASDRAGTVEIRLVRADPTFLLALALPFAHVVPKETSTSEVASPPPGAGPYFVRSHTAGRRLVLDRNPDAAARGELRTGRVDRIDVRLDAGRQEALGDLRDGDLDFAQLRPTAAERRALAGSDSRARVVRSAEAAVYYFFMNTRVAPFHRQGVRRAVNAAMDRARLADIFDGDGVPTAQLLPPVIPGFRRLQVARPDLEQARRLVGAAGARGASVTVWGQTSEPSASATREMASTLRRIGLRPQVRLLERTRLLRRYADLSNRVQIGYARWIPTIPDGADYFATLLGGGRTGRLNYAGLDVAAVTRLIARARATADPPRRAALWTAVERAVASRAPWAPFAYTLRSDAIARRVSGHVPHVVLGFLWMRAEVR